MFFISLMQKCEVFVTPAKDFPYFVWDFPYNVIFAVFFRL